MDTLKAEKRDMTTKAKKLRRDGYVTGNVFGREIDGSIPVKITKKDADRLFKSKKRGSQIMLDVEGQKMDVLIKDISYNAMKGQIEELDFQALVSNEKVHSVAEVVILNHDKVQGAIVQQVLEEIAYRALPSALVEKVEIDVAEMKAGDVVKVKDLPIAADKDVELHTPLDATVVMITVPHNSAIAEEPAAGDEAAEKTDKAK
ncbi:MAG: 50S ribosomal protein L25 [Clostridiales bacterium]|nr:50S ribosomal protein L25 [Clostridiales bacterium]